jgi:AcrR family transcriptional regulator
MKNMERDLHELSPTHGRRRLLSASLKLFSERGYAGTALRDIAEEASVSLGLIRTHFGTKEDLRRAVDEYALERIRKLYGAVLEHSGRHALEQLVDDAVQWVSSEKDALMYARASLLEATPGSEKLFSELLNIMREFIERNAEKGFLQDDVDRDWAALYMLFDFIGPAIFEPFAKKELGSSMYSKKMIAARNSFMKRAFTRGFFKA